MKGVVIEMKNKLIISFVFLILCCALSAGCNSPTAKQNSAVSEAQEDNSQNQSDAITQEQAELQGQQEEQAEQAEQLQNQPEAQPVPVFYSLTTGLECKEQDMLTRPYAVMMDNVKVATPQNGISHADVVYEVTVEGGITRLLSIFSDYTGEYTIGAVRSSRDYYIDLAQAHNAIYVHAGGSPEAYSVLYSRKINNLDGVNNGPASSFWRDSERRKARLSSEHCMVTNPLKVAEGIQIKKYSTQISDGFVSPFAFYNEDTEIKGESALRVSVAFSSKCAFEYDDTARIYKKFQYGDMHTDRDTQEQLAFKNVLVLTAPHKSTGDEKGRIKVDFTGSGNGYYAVNGVYKKIVWKKQNRTTPYALFEQDGTTPLLLCPGKSYIAIANTNIKVSFE